MYSTVCHNYCWISTSHVMAYWECGNILVSSMWSYLVWQAITFVLRKRSIIQPEIFWLCFMSRGKISKYVKWYLVWNCISFTTNVKISNEEIVYRWYIVELTWYQNKWNVFYFILRYTYWKKSSRLSMLLLHVYRYIAFWILNRNF